MAEAVTVELDAQYRQLREECGLLDRSDRGKLLRQRPRGRRVPAGPADQRHRGAGAGRGLLRGAARPQGAHAGRHAGAAPRPRTRSGSTPSRRRWRRPAATSRCTRSGARSRSRTSTRAARDPLADRPAQRRARRRSRRCPSTPAKRSRVEGIECLAVGTALGIDLIAAAARRRAPARLPWPRPAPPRSTPAAAEILRDRGRHAALRREMDTATMPAEAGIVERAVNFEKGCYIGQETVARLHYKGKPNRHLRGLRLSAPASPGAALCARREGGRQARRQLRLPRPRTDRAGDRAPRGRARRRAAVGEDGVTARVVDLPFG